MLFTSIVLAFIQLFLIIITILFEYKRKSSAIYLWAMLLVLFGIMHFITVVSNSDKFPLWVYDSASLFVIFFCLIYLMTRMALPAYAIRFPKWRDMTEHSFSEREKRFIVCTFVLLLVTVIYKIYSMVHGSGGLMNTSWSSGRSISAESNYFSKGKVITCLYNYACSAILLSVFSKKKIMTVLSAFLVISLVIITRNRVEVLSVMVSAIAYYLYNGTRLSSKKILTLAGIGALSLVGIYALHIFRYYGNFIQLINQFDLSDFTSNIFNNMSHDKGDIGLREVFYYFIYNHNQFENFGQGHTYIRMLLVFFPTAWSFGLKPPDFAISMGTAMNTGIEGFSTHPTLFGDCYANFGYSGVFMGVFWALFAQMFDYLVYRNKPVVKISLIVLSGNAYIIMGRGSVYNAFIWMLWGTILMFVVYYLSNRSIRFKKKRVLSPDPSGCVMNCMSSKGFS